MTHKALIRAFLRRSDAHRHASANLASYALEWREAPNYSPARKAYHDARAALMRARYRLDRAANAISYEINGEVAAAYLDTALRNADLAATLKVKRINARRPKAGVA